MQVGSRSLSLRLLAVRLTEIDMPVSTMSCAIMRLVRMHSRKTYTLFGHRKRGLSSPVAHPGSQHVLQTVFQVELKS